MQGTRLAFRAAVAQAPLLAAMGALVLVVTAILAGLPRYLESAELTNARETLASAAPTDAAVQAQVRLAADAPAQAAAMDEVLAPLLSGTSAIVLRSAQSDAVATVLPDTSSAGILYTADPAALARIDVVGGAWPGDGVALQALAAEALGLEVGDVLRVADQELRIVALWEAIDPADPAWFGDEAVATGAAGGAYGPALVTEDALAALDVNPFARWTLLPDLVALRSDGMAPLGRAAENWEAAIRADAALSGGGVVFAGGLAATVMTIERGIASVRGVAPIPLVVSGVIGGIAFLQLARLLSGVRAAETLLLRTRGRSTADAGTAAARETAVVAAPSAAAGALAAVLLVPDVDGWGAWITGLAVAAAAVLIVAVVSALAARSAHAPHRATVGGYIAALALAVIGAGVSLWQFRLYGSPVLTTASGDVIVDPLAVLAVPIALLACAIAAVAALPIIIGSTVRGASRGTSLGAALVTRQVSRRPAAFAVPVMLTALAVAATVIASSYAATWGAATVRAGELRNGADLRVSLVTSSTVGGPATITSSTPFEAPGSRAAPVLVAQTEAGDDDVTLVALAATEFDVMSTAGGALDRDALASTLDAAPAGLALDPEATEVEFSLTTSTTPAVSGTPLAPNQGTTSASAWVADAQGALARLDLIPDESGTLRASLPVGVAPWIVLALDTAITTGPTPAIYNVSITPTGLATPGDWSVRAGASTDVGDALVDTGPLAYRVAVDAPTAPILVRLMPAAAPPPLAITDAFAERLGIGVGDELRLRFAGSGLALKGVVADVVPRIPGTTSPLAALADLRAVDAALLSVSSSIPRPAEIWIASDEPEATAAALAPVLPPGATVTSIGSGSGEALQRPVVTALWVGALGSLLLAAAAVAAVATSLLRSRRSEVVALRALGVRDRVQARARAAELALVVAIGVVAGLAAGYGVAVLTIGDLARSAVLDAPRALETPVLLDLPRLAIALAAYALVVVALLALTALRVRRQAATSTGREVEA